MISTTGNSARVNSAISLSDVCYSYTDEWTRRKKSVLKGLSLEIKQGESFGFLGHNGAGKTTTIKAILGLIRIQRGEISIAGQHWRDPEARRVIGYLPEQPYFYDHLSVSEIMALYACLAGVPRSARSTAIAKALSLVNLSSRANSRMRTLSKGLMQRVALAQALVASPQILILDEPFSGLDPIGRKEFREIFANLKHTGVTIFMSSHILSDVEFLCDRASILVKGELKGVFDLREPSSALGAAHYELLVRGDKTFASECRPAPERVVIEDRFVRLVFADRGAAESALRLALSKGIEIQSFELERSSLEDVFMDVARREGVTSIS